MLVQGAKNKNNNRALCVTVRYKKNVGLTTVTVLKYVTRGMNTYQYRCVDVVATIVVLSILVVV